MLKLVWDVGQSVRDVVKLVRTTQLDAAVLCDTEKRVIGRLPRLLFFDFLP